MAVAFKEINNVPSSGMSVPAKKALSSYEKKLFVLRSDKTQRVISIAGYGTLRYLFSIFH